MLEKFGHFGNFMLPENFEQVIMIEERFHLSSRRFRKILTLE